MLNSSFSKGLFLTRRVELSGDWGGGEGRGSENFLGIFDGGVPNLSSKS